MLPPFFATWYRNISSTISLQPWFHNLDLPRKVIISFIHLRFGHTLLPAHSYKFSLNNSPHCTFHDNPVICEISHIIFNYPKLSPQRTKLLSLLNSFNIPFNIPDILSTQQKNIITHILSFFKHSGFLI